MRVGRCGTFTPDMSPGPFVNIYGAMGAGPYTISGNIVSGGVHAGGRAVVAVTLKAGTTGRSTATNKAPFNVLVIRPFLCARVGGGAREVRRAETVGVPSNPAWSGSGPTGTLSGAA